MTQSGAANLIIITWRCALFFHHKTTLRKMKADGGAPFPPPSAVQQDIRPGGGRRLWTDPGYRYRNI